MIGPRSAGSHSCFWWRKPEAPLVHIPAYLLSPFEFGLAGQLVWASFKAERRPSGEGLTCIRLPPQPHSPVWVLDSRV